MYTYIYIYKYIYIYIYIMKNISNKYISNKIDISNIGNICKFPCEKFKNCNCLPEKKN